MKNWKFNYLITYVYFGKSGDGQYRVYSYNVQKYIGKAWLYAKQFQRCDYSFLKRYDCHINHHYKLCIGNRNYYLFSMAYFQEEEKNASMASSQDEKIIVMWWLKHFRHFTFNFMTMVFLTFNCNFCNFLFSHTNALVILVLNLSRQQGCIS